MRSIRPARGAALAVWLASTALPAAALAQSAIQSTAPAIQSVPAATPAPEAAAPLAVPAPAAAAPAATEAGPATPRGMTESVAAVINDEIISTYDLRQRIRLLIVSTGVQPTNENLPQIEREALRALVDERLQEQELTKVEQKQKFKVFPTDKEIDAEVEDMAKTYNVHGPQLIKSLEGAGIEPATLRDQLRTQLGWRKYVSGRFRDNVHVGDDQISAALARFNASAAKPQFLVSEVFLDAARVGGQQQAQDGARQLVDQMRKGEAPFPAVARQFSALPSAANGGDAGWMASDELPPELEKAVETMKPGQVSEPIPVHDGVYIVQLREKRAGSTANVLDLKQAAIALSRDAPATDVAAAQAKLVTLRGEVHGCDELQTRAGKVSGVVAGDLGETSLDDLSPDFRGAVEGLKPGEVSQPVRTGQGLHLIAVCARHVGGGKEPTRADIENRIYGEQLGMIARRFLRDLRNSAAIENR